MLVSESYTFGPKGTSAGPFLRIERLPSPSSTPRFVGDGRRGLAALSSRFVTATLADLLVNT